MMMGEKEGHLKRKKGPDKRKEGRENDKGGKEGQVMEEEDRYQGVLNSPYRVRQHLHPAKSLRSAALAYKRQATLVLPDLTTSSSSSSHTSTPS